MRGDRPDKPGLARFHAAQDRGDIWRVALEELRSGQKRSHWMWFVFPQLRGLGMSAMAERYGMADLAEARAYAADPVLGPRLVDCCRRLLAVQGRSARQILGTPDDLKLRSSMTLFERAAPGVAEFAQVIDRYFSSVRDDRTLSLLAAAEAGGEGDDAGAHVDARLDTGPEVCLDAATAPMNATAPLRALWHGLHGDWDRAHEIVQAEDDRDSAWVHAWLHRMEGDLGNAGYWYRRAGRPVATGESRAEALTIARTISRASE